jgi:hypothetical protein
MLQHHFKLRFILVIQIRVLLYLHGILAMVQISLPYEQVKHLNTSYSNLYQYFLATQFDQPDTRSHRYLSVGTYTLTITAQGPVNTVVKTFSVAVQYPVSNFTISFPSIAGSPSQVGYGGSRILS